MSNYFTHQMNFTPENSKLQIYNRVDKQKLKLVCIILCINGFCVLSYFIRCDAISLLLLFFSTFNNEKKNTFRRNRFILYHDRSQMLRSSTDIRIICSLLPHSVVEPAHQYGWQTKTGKFVTKNPSWIIILVFGRVCWATLKIIHIYFGINAKDFS